MTRDWRLARAKVAREGRCRVCGARWPLEAAHILGRDHDWTHGLRPADGDVGVVVVDPRHVVPLCGGPRLPEREAPCHWRYDHRMLDLLPFLSVEEQAAAVLIVGIEAARRRLIGGSE